MFACHGLQCGHEFIIMHQHLFLNVQAKMPKCPRSWNTVPLSGFLAFQDVSVDKHAISARNVTCRTQWSYSKQHFIRRCDLDQQGEVHRCEWGLSKTRGAVQYARNVTGWPVPCCEPRSSDTTAREHSSSRALVTNKQTNTGSHIPARDTSGYSVRQECVVHTLTNCHKSRMTCKILTSNMGGLKLIEVLTLLGETAAEHSARNVNESGVWLRH